MDEMYFIIISMNYYHVCVIFVVLSIGHICDNNIVLTKLQLLTI